MCNYCLINQNELPVPLLLPSSATCPQSFPPAESSSPLISINQNTASSEVGISCSPSLQVIWPLSVLPEHLVQIFVCVLFCFVLCILSTGHIWACIVLTDVRFHLLQSIVSSWTAGHSLFLFAAPSRTCILCAQSWGDTEVRLIVWSRQLPPCLPLSCLSLPCVFVSFTYRFSSSSH